MKSLFALLWWQNVNMDKTPKLILEREAPNRTLPVSIIKLCIELVNKTDWRGSDKAIMVTLVWQWMQNVAEREIAVSASQVLTFFYYFFLDAVIRPKTTGWSRCSDDSSYQEIQDLQQHLVKLTPLSLYIPISDQENNFHVWLVLDVPSLEQADLKTFTKLVLVVVKIIKRGILISLNYLKNIFVLLWLEASLSAGVKFIQLVTCGSSFAQVILQSSTRNVLLQQGDLLPLRPGLLIVDEALGALVR